MIPVNVPQLDGNEKKYLKECIDTGWISSEGPFVREFEKRFAARGWDAGTILPFATALQRSRWRSLLTASVTATLAEILA